MATNVGAHAQPTHIRWEFVQPGREGDVDDTHCCLCYDAETPSPILAHRITAAGEIGHRVHRACLLRADKNECSMCRRPYDPSELPKRTIEIITDMLSEGKALGNRIATNFSTYAVGGIVFSALCLAEPIASGLLLGNFSPLLGVGIGSVIGSCMTATALSLVGDVSLYAGRCIMEWTNVQNPMLRKVILVATSAIAVVASVYVTTLLFSAIEAQIVAQLAPEARAVYSYLMGNAYTGSGVSRAMWNAANLAADRVAGIVVGSISTFFIAYFVKVSLAASAAHLDETIFSIE